MFGSILKIGECVREQSGEFLPIEERLKEGLGAKIIFDLDSHLLDCEIFECKGEKAKEKAREFLWIGNPRGNVPQLRLTTNSLEYILNSKRGHKWCIGSMIKYIEDANLLTDEDIKSLYQYLSEIRKVFFTGEKDLTSEFEEVCNKKDISIGLKEITLYTISVRKSGRLIDLTKELGYRKIIQYILRYEKTRKYPMKYGRCHICSKEDKVLVNPDYPKGTILGIYVIDKAGFLSNISRSEDSLLRTHAICINCKENLTLGINYINNNLSTRVGDLNAWIVPTFIGREMDINTIDCCRRAFEVAKYGGLRLVKEVEEYIEKRFSRIGTIPVINIIFGRSQQSQFIFHGLIQDVPLMRLVEIGKKAVELTYIAKYFAEDSDRWSIGFETISGIFPLSKVSGEVKVKPLIELFDAMLRNTFYPKEYILERALLYVRVHRFGSHGKYNIREVAGEERDEKICRGLLLYNSLLKFLMELEVVYVEKRVELLALEGVDKSIAGFCNEQGYTDWQIGLFLLGLLVGKIGTEQFKKGDKKKSILDKIDFDGMSAEKVKWLTNIVLEGLRNYRILEHNETIYSQAKKLIDKTINYLKDPVDNTFYILSGYAYATLHAIVGVGGERYEWGSE